MDSCICYSTCNDTEQHSTYSAVENAFEYQDQFDSENEYLVQRIGDMDEDAGKIATEDCLFECYL